MNFVFMSIVGLFLFQTTCSYAESNIPVTCGKTIICDAGRKCTMLDGDYNLFEQFIGTKGTFKLNKVTLLWPGKLGKRNAFCQYSRYDGITVDFYNIKTNPMYVLENTDPSSPDYGWHREKTPDGRYYTCDATKFVCQMYY